MIDKRTVEVKVVSQQGYCACGHKVGDRWIFGSDGKSPAGLCNGAFAALFPHIRTLQGGGVGTYDENSAKTGTISLQCPDAANPIVFELRVV